MTALDDLRLLLGEHVNLAYLPGGRGGVTVYIAGRLERSARQPKRGSSQAPRFVIKTNTAQVEFPADAVKVFNPKENMLVLQ